MLPESLLAITSFLTGKAVRKSTVKEIKKFKKIIVITPLIISLALAPLILLQYPSGALLMLVGGMLSLVFRKRNDEAQLVFATITLLLTTTSAAYGLTFALLFILYFTIKGSIDESKPLSGTIMIVLGVTAFIALNFVKIIDYELSLVLSCLFIGAVVGGEAAFVIKNKSETWKR